MYDNMSSHTILNKARTNTLQMSDINRHKTEDDFPIIRHFLLPRTAYKRAESKHKPPSAILLKVKKTNFGIPYLTRITLKKGKS